MKKIILIFLLIWNVATAQPNVNYNDVVVIVNDNSQASIAIGNYFKTKRNIPLQNIIHISCTNNEEVDSITFSQIRFQIENALTGLPNLNDINYLVTTKGLPLKVLNGDINTAQGIAKSASFDSELALILGTNATSISSGINPLNPFSNESGHFLRSQYGIFLVTRLDGYSINDVFKLIDKSGPNSAVNKQSAKIIFNYANVSVQAEKNLFYNIMKPAFDSLLSDSWNAIIDTSNSLSQFENNVLGFTCIYHSVVNQQPNFSWVNGAVAEITTGNSASTFDPNLTTNNRFTIADLVAEGISGAHGYVYDIYLSFSLNTMSFYLAYTDTSNHFNLAESYFKSMNRLSVADIVIGDPKTSIVIDNTVGLSINTEENEFEIFPNPNSGMLYIKNACKIQEFILYDIYGNLIKNSKYTNPSVIINLDLTKYEDGLYLLKLIDMNGMCFSKKIIKSQSR